MALLLLGSHVFAASGDTFNSVLPSVFSLHRGAVYRGATWNLIEGWVHSIDDKKKLATVKALPPFDSLYRVDIATMTPPELDRLKEGFAKNPERFLVLFVDIDPESYTRIPGPKDLSYKELDPVRPGKYVSIEELIRNAESSADLNDFVRRIPKGALKEFTLAHTTGSPQGASHDCPRVIRYNENATFIMAYRGCGHKADPSVDVIRFDDKSRELKFSQFVFGKNGVKVTRDSAQECNVCHQSNNRTFSSYIWTGYPKWPNMYGSGEDSYLDPSETEKFLKFRRNQAKSVPAYSALRWSEEDEYFPFSIQARRDEDTLNQIMVDRRPNKILTAALSRLKALQMAKVIESHEAFGRIKYLLLMDSLRCGGRESTISELASVLELYTGQKPKLTDKPYVEPWDGDGDPRNEATDIYRVSRALGLSAEDWNISVTDGPIPRYRKDKPDYFFGTFQLSANVIGALLKDIVKSEFPELKSHIRFMSEISYDFGRASPLYGDTDSEVEALTPAQRARVCGALKTRHQSFKKVFARRDQARRATRIAGSAPSHQPLANGAPPGLKHCIACHDRGEAAPQISFGDPHRLAERLKEAPLISPKGTLLEDAIARIDRQDMPPDGNISDSDRERIKQYLMRLTGN